MRIASASSSNGIAASTGPNTSSQASAASRRHVAQQRAARRSSRRAARRRRSCLSPTIAMPVALRVGEKAAHARELRRANQRPAIEIGERGPDAQRREALRRAARAPPRSATRSTSRRLPAEQVWPAFCTMALTSTGSAASRSASAKTICGPLPPSSSVTGQCRSARRPRRPTRRSRGDPVNETMLDAGMRGERRARLAAEAGDDVERAVGQADLRGELGDAQQRQAGVLRRLHHARVAGGERRRRPSGRRSAADSSRE